VIASPRSSAQSLWLGHVTFLLQMHGWHILTDPVFSARASPVQFMGPKRFTPPGAPLASLPPLHVVTISHNH
jgi:N-acyl-phosphatidylethanolamine-hydrolysing phospholipase D